MSNILGTQTSGGGNPAIEDIRQDGKTGRGRGFTPKKVGELLCRSAKPNETHEALKLVLGHGGRPADEARVVDFLRYAVGRKLDLSRLSLITRDDQAVWAILPMMLPGQTALLLAPSFVPASYQAAAEQLIELTLEDLQDAQFAQVLIDPADASATQPFAKTGFSPLATLLYLQRVLTTMPVSLPPPPDLRAVHYTSETHDLFRRAIQASYIDSMDCPKLNGLRSIDHVIEGHQGSGEFRPDLWTVLARGDEPAAVLLMNPTGNEDSTELVYLGVSPDFRGMGLGHWAVRHVLAETYRLGFSRMTLAVDSTNRPALKLYYRFGMQRVHERLALMRDLRPIAK